MLTYFKIKHVATPLLLKGDCKGTCFDEIKCKLAKNIFGQDLETGG